MVRLSKFGKKGFFLVFLFTIFLAAVLRLSYLDIRPVHFDEGGGYSIHALSILEKGEYYYVPVYHGPFIYHITALSFFLFGISEFTLRLPEALFGIALVMLVWPLRTRFSFLGFSVVCFFMAVSPSLVYYSRFALTDPFFIFFMLLFIICITFYAREKKRIFLFMSSASISLLFTVKENAYISLFICITYVLFEALIHLAGLRNKPPGTLSKDFLRVSDGLYSGMREIIYCVLIFFAIYTLFYSSFLAHIESVPSLFHPVTNWIEKSTQDMRFNQPQDYYLKILAGIELPILVLGVFGAAISLIGRDYFRRFLGFWTFATILIYSLIPYKLPNLLINITLPLILASGVFVDELHSRAKIRPFRIIIHLGILLSIVFLLYTAVDLSFVHHADWSSNPLVFVQAPEEIKDLLREVDYAAVKSGEGLNMSIAVSVPQWEYPLSWYWRKYPNAVFLHEKIGVPSNWTASGGGGYTRVVWTSYEKKSGNRSVLISSEKGSKARWIANVSVEGGKDYELSAWIRTEDLEAVINRSSGAVIRVTGSDGFGDNIAETEPILGTMNWSREKLEFHVPADEELLWIYCESSGAGIARGSVWFDDLSLKLKGSDMELLNNPGFEDGNITEDTFNATVIVLSENDGQQLESIPGYGMKKYLLRPGVNLAVYIREDAL